MKIIYKDGHVDECPQDQELHVIRHTAYLTSCQVSSSAPVTMVWPLAASIRS